MNKILSYNDNDHTSVFPLGIFFTKAVRVVKLHLTDDGFPFAIHDVLKPSPSYFLKIFQGIFLFRYKMY